MKHRVRRHRFRSSLPAGAHGRWRAIAIVLMCAVLAACGGDNGSGVQEDRRFATDPEPPPPPPVESPGADPTATAPIPTPTPFPRPPAATPAPFESTVETVYALVGDMVVAVDVETGASQVVARSGAEARPVAIAPAPDGRVVAIAWQIDEGPGRFDVEVRSRDGEIRHSWSDVEASLGSPPGPIRGRVAIAWSASGDRLAVTFPRGGAVQLRMSGEAITLLTRSQAPAPLAIEWSPKGDAIAYTSRDLDGEGAYLAIAAARVLPVDPVRIAGTGGMRPIYDIAWLPGGDGLLAVQGGSGSNGRVGGDLIQIDRRTLSAHFAIGGSRFGPMSDIVAVEASPDGHHWAIVTVAPGARSGLEAAVWLVTPDLASVVRLDLAEDPPVAGVTWTVAGLTVTLFEPDYVRVATFERDGAAIVAATPVASPEAAGSPVASPLAEGD